MRPSILVAGLCLCPPAAAQLTDLQAGRNFPTAINAFGGNHTEDVDIGDVDNDGDYDVVVANGGNSGDQPNRIFVNNGGVQGGTPGTFTEGTSTRFAGLPLDTSRDADFVDVDGDGDLDIYIANRGTSIAGQVSRVYLNRGGLQLGPAGFFQEGTDHFWGALASVPAAREAVQPGDGVGAWLDWSCDCDFGDLDDDGDIDLFHSSYGPNIQGNEESRLFLNDSTGRFDERFPWIDAGADVRLHTLDIDLLDIDGDFDIDVFASSRESQARVYRNNLTAAGWVGDAFTDITQTSLIDTGAGLVGNSNYGAEYADMDGDGDFDVWATSYEFGFRNAFLSNNGDGTFTKLATGIQSDTASDDNEADFFDFDSDGDLDAFVSGFAPGVNQIYQSGVAQGLTAGQGFMHRNGATSGGSQATWPEGPTNNQNNISLDGGAADMDGDGDPDVLIANDNLQQNRYWANVLGVPDTHAPTFEAVTVQGDKSDGSDTVIHAAVRDNANFTVVGLYDVLLVYDVDGGAETCLRMFSQGSQIFRGVIPGALNGTVTYRVEATDDAGNTGVSSSTAYVQTSSSSSEWQVVDCGTSGVNGVPYLEGRGTNPAIVKLLDGAPSAAAALFMSVSATPLPFKGGTLYPSPIIVNLPLVTGSAGEIVFPIDLSTLPTGFPIWWQVAIQDSAAIGQVSVSNAALSTAP